MRDDDGAGPEQEPGKEEGTAPEAAQDEGKVADTVILEENRLEMTLEALLFVARTPATAESLASAAKAGRKAVRDALERMRGRSRSRGIVLEEVAGGWQLRTNPALSEPVKRFLQVRPVRLSKPALETLSMIAYMQPVTKARVEEIRGVDSGGVLKFLMDHGLVRIIGKKEEPGRPFLYGTSKYFLEFFGLRSLDDMPRLREQIDLTEEELGGLAPPGEEEAEAGEDEAALPQELCAILDGAAGDAAPETTRGEGGASRGEEAAGGGEEEREDEGGER